MANGTCLGRILHPADWLIIPSTVPNPVVRVCDATGALLAIVSQ